MEDRDMEPGNNIKRNALVGKNVLVQVLHTGLGFSITHHSGKVHSIDEGTICLQSSGGFGETHPFADTSHGIGLIFDSDDKTILYFNQNAYSFYQLPIDATESLVKRITNLERLSKRGKFY